MNENKETKKYFIKDEELTSISEDKLSSKDIAKEIELIIDNTKTPFSIAVTGKSGSGKSSIINLVTEKYKQDSEFYNVKKINMWKEENSSLKSILDENYARNNNVENIEEAENIQINNQNIEKNEEVINNEINNKKTKSPVLKRFFKVLKALLIFGMCFLITTLIYIFMEYMTSRDIYNSNDIFFVENTYLSYRDNIGIILVFALGLTLITYIINTLRLASKKQRKTIIQENHENTINEQQTIEINSKQISENINYIKQENNKNSIIDTNKTNLIIIEDIDKLPVSKMLKTLEDVKYCDDYDNCIFIVPFDEKLLLKAIDARNQMKISGNYRPLKFEKIMDKIFQFKIYVPRISNGDIKDYALDLVNESISDFTNEYIEIKTFEKIIRNIIIYKNVTTPRHVKKLINNFISNKILISYRVENAKIDRNIVNVNNFDYQLAKLSVIQSDFADFYETLFKDFSYLDTLTEYYCMNIDELRNAYENIDEELKPFFTAKYRALMNFLIQTKNCKIENLSTLLYLTKFKTEKIFKDKTVLSYILGEEDVSELRIQEVLELVKLIDSKEDIKEFNENNFEKLFEKYKENSSNKVYFTGFNEYVELTYDNIDEDKYVEYLQIVANNYNYYPEEALNVFKNTKIEISTEIMNVLVDKINKGISKENYDESFEFLRNNSDPFYEEDGNLSDYVQFLVNNIGLASNPTEVIKELDENFNRIGKVYELNKNIQGLDNLDYNYAYNFLAKCLDNGDLDRMVNITNSILSDENSVEGYLNILDRMKNYNIVDIIECNVDDILDGVFKENNILLKNLIELASNKQDSIDPTDVMKLIETALKNNDEEYNSDIYNILNKFDRMYFYEIRRDFNEVIYSNFHKSKSIEIKKAALECTRYFKNTRLFKTKLDKEEEKFYEEN